MKARPAWSSGQKFRRASICLKAVCSGRQADGIIHSVKQRLTSVLLLLAAIVARAEMPAERHFTDKVKPLLDSRCISCHGPDKVKGGLRMDSREALLKGGDSGPAIVLGKPADSLLLQAVMHSKKDLEMPPKEKLTTNDVVNLKKWIEVNQIQIIKILYVVHHLNLLMFFKNYLVFVIHQLN